MVTGAVATRFSGPGDNFVWCPGDTLDLFAEIYLKLAEGAPRNMWVVDSAGLGDFIFVLLLPSLVPVRSRPAHITQLTRSHHTAS